MYWKEWLDLCMVSPEWASSYLDTTKFQWTQALSTHRRSWRYSTWTFSRNFPCLNLITWKIIRFHQDILSNTADIAHFEGIHTMSGIVSPWQVLRKGKLYYIARKIFRFDYQAQWENGVGHDSHIAFMEAKITPVLFGFEINMLQTITRTKICPPVLYITTKMSKFKQIGFYLISVLTPMSLMKNLFTHNIYHGPGFFSKLLARIGLYSVVILVSMGHKRSSKINIISNQDKFYISFFEYHGEKLTDN